MSASIHYSFYDEIINRINEGPHGEAAYTGKYLESHCHWVTRKIRFFEAHERALVREMISAQSDHDILVKWYKEGAEKAEGLFEVMDRRREIDENYHGAPTRIALLSKLNPFSSDGIPFNTAAYEFVTGRRPHAIYASSAGLRFGEFTGAVNQSFVPRYPQHEAWSPEELNEIAELDRAAARKKAAAELARKLAEREKQLQWETCLDFEVSFEDWEKKALRLATEKRAEIRQAIKDSEQYTAWQKCASTVRLYKDSKNFVSR